VLLEWTCINSALQTTIEWVLALMSFAIIAEGCGISTLRTVAANEASSGSS
jgi:hypothetical protein